MDVLLFLLFLKELFYFFYFFFYFFIKNLIAWGGQDFLNFWEIQVSKKNTSTIVFAFFLGTTLWLQRDSRAKWTYRFFKKSWPPFLTVSLISTKINLFVHWYFQRQFGYCWRQSQKSQFSHLEIIISVFFISITIRCTTA